MKQFKQTLTIVLVLAGVLSWAAETETAETCFKNLPYGCFVTKSFVVPPDQTAAIGKKLGTPLKRLSNTYLTVQGKPIQVNILEAKTNADAVKLHKTISKMKNHPAFCLVEGNKVIEFCSNDATTAIKTSYELGFLKKPKQIRYCITAHISTVEKADYMSFNKLFNVFLTTNTRNPSKDALSQIAELSKRFQFGNSIAMRVPQQQGTHSGYSFTPLPNKTESSTGDTVVYSFNKPPRVLGIPYVTLKAELTCEETGMTQTERKADKTLVSATQFWPADDPQVVALAQRITAGKRAPEEKVQAILEWLTPGRNIRSAGPTGSRWGVKKVLKQKYGHCWDSCDCFVTLCRASGIPCRQVGGWLYGTSGHIWAEVLIEGKGWKQVDPTGGGKLECGIYHIPYFTTETGEMPILYVSMPKIEILETK